MTNITPKFGKVVWRDDPPYGGFTASIMGKTKQPVYVLHIKINNDGRWFGFAAGVRTNHKGYETRKECEDACVFLYQTFVIKRIRQAMRILHLHTDVNLEVVEEYGKA